MTHPGKVDKPAERRTKAEVKQEKKAKAQAKEALAEARQQSINRAAEFEHADIANEDMVDATPRPTFIPKPRPLSLKRKNSPLTSLADTSDGETDVGESPFIPNSKGLADADEDVESDAPQAPPTKNKAKTIPKATPAKKRESTDVEANAPDSDEEVPKPKKAKMKMRDEIDIATTNIVKNERGLGNKYAKLLNSSGEPASKVSSRSSKVQAELGGRPLKREGAIADFEKLIVRGGKKSTVGAFAAINPDSSTRADPENNGR